jgi:hypothetical protein
MKNLLALVTFKVLFSFVALAALGTEIIVLVERDAFTAANFFSFFTVLSNLFAAIVLLVAAGARLQGKKPQLLEYVRGAATLYMATTGIVFALLLSGLEGVQFTVVPWTNIVLHYVMPIVLVVDWLWDQPTKAIPFKKAVWWIALPVAYVVYSLIRGVLVDWYPYPFLNPDNGGYLSVAVITLVIALGGVGAAWLLTLRRSR